MSTKMDDTNLPPIPQSSTNKRQKAPSEATSFKMKRKDFRPSLMVLSCPDPKKVDT